MNAGGPSGRAHLDKTEIVYAAGEIGSNFCERAGNESSRRDRADVAGRAIASTTSTIRRFLKEESG